MRRRQDDVIGFNFLWGRLHEAGPLFPPAWVHLKLTPPLCERHEWIYHYYGIR